MVGARLRCQGFMCPQWALDIGRYDVIQQVNTTYQYVLQELLPLAPTVERSMNVLTAYDTTSRTITVAACDYPGQGIDSFWVSTVSSDIESATPVYSNIMIPHPDASINNPGSIRLVRIISVSSSSVIALFSDNSVCSIDLINQKYTVLAKLSDKYALTTAHVVDGTVLKSFLQNEVTNRVYLVTTDLSVSPIAPSDPIEVAPIAGMTGLEVPFESHIVQSSPDSETELLLLWHGEFDSITTVDEATGTATAIFASMSEFNEPAEFFCDAGTKDCDMWMMSSYDSVSRALYFQAHTAEGDDEVSASIYKMNYVENHITKEWFPIANVAMAFMQFGYSGMQFVNFE